MTDQEFDDFIEYASSCFPSLVDLFRKTEFKTLGPWREAFRDADYRNCRTAVGQMLAGDRDRVFNEGFPAAVKKAAREIGFEGSLTSSPANMRPDDRYMCSQCLDSGWVTVVSTSNPRAMFSDPPEDWQDIEERDWKIHVRTCLSPCDQCQAGEYLANRRWKTGATSVSTLGPPVSFDASRMCRVDPTWHSKRKFHAMIEFLGNWKPRNYNTEFAEYESHEPAGAEF